MYLKPSVVTVDINLYSSMQSRDLSLFTKLSVMLFCVHTLQYWVCYFIIGFFGVLRVPVVM